MSNRRWASVLVFIGMVVMIAVASPATAAKFGKPGPPAPDTVLVTLSYEGDTGIATSGACNGELTNLDGDLTMTLDGESLFMEWEDKRVEMNFEWPAGPEWPAGSLSGCHGPLIAGSDDDFSGNLALVQQRDGTVNLSSLFDYTWRYETVNKRQVQALLDFYSINGYLTPDGDFVWEPGGGGTLSGDLLLKHFHKVYKDGDWEVLGTFEVTITVEISS